MKLPFYTVSVKRLFLNKSALLMALLFVTSFSAEIFADEEISSLAMGQ